MKNFIFGWTGPGLLIEELSKPIQRVSLVLGGQSRPEIMTMWHSDSSGLRICSEMHDVAEYKEMGVLQFTCVSAPSEGEVYVKSLQRSMATLQCPNFLSESQG